MSLNPTLSDSNWCKLAELFLTKSDGKTIFPKLPSMLKTYHIRWQQNQLISQIERKLKAPVAGVIQKLLRERAVQQNDQEENPRLGEVAAHVPAINFVPPIAAPQQEAFVETALIKRTKRLMHCFYEPFCDSWADDCGGSRIGKCTRVNCGEVIIPDDPNEFERQKENAVKEQRARERRERRH